MSKKFIISVPVIIVLVLLNVYCMHPEETTVNNKTLNKRDTVNVVDSKDEIDVNHLIGKFNYRNDSGFELVESGLSSKTTYLRKEVYQKFKQMHEAARKDGINLKIVSGTRSFDEQKGIWERKWETNFKALNDSVKAAKKILLFSSMPCTSRHHWGTDMDLNNLNNKYFESGQGLKEYKWLQENGSKFGFCQVYDDKTVTKRKGYELEKWHWSYMPVSTKFLNQYKEKVTYAKIKGFKGDHLASNEQIKMIDNFVFGINTKCSDSH
jgi:D-alanyl-D-alanine carboxypeptidase